MVQTKSSSKRPKTEDDTSIIPSASTSQNIATLPGDDDDDDVGGAHNPMTNDVVLQRMFELSSPVELNNYRRVCPHWRNVARPLWLKKSGFTIVIKDEEDNDTFLKFLEHVQPNQDNIIGIIKQRNLGWNLTIRTQSYNRRDRFELLWTKCGVHLTQLTLQNINIPDPATFQDILFCRHTPNLETLVADIDTIEGAAAAVEPLLLHNNDIPREQGNLRTLEIDVAKLSTPHVLLDWKSLFNTFPNLTDFRIGAYLPFLDSMGSQTETDRILEAMIEIRTEDPKKLALTSFTIFFNLRDDDDYPEEQTLSFPTLASLKAVQFFISGHKCRI